VQNEENSVMDVKNRGTILDNCTKMEVAR